jgi:serine/threonine-protein kinase HipA
VPTDVWPRILSTAIVEGDDRSASVELAFLAAEHFGIKHEAADEVARDVARSVAQRREVGRSLGASAQECDRMASAFEHDDLAALT